MCKLPNGALIDHDPTKERDDDKVKATRYARTLELFASRWGTPDEDFWPQLEEDGEEEGVCGGACEAPNAQEGYEERLDKLLEGASGRIGQIFVRVPTGKTITLDVYSSFTILQVKGLIEVCLTSYNIFHREGRVCAILTLFPQHRHFPPTPIVQGRHSFRPAAPVIWSTPA